MKSYLKFLSRNKLYTAIEAAGLIVSLAFVVIIGTSIRDQLRISRAPSGQENLYLLGPPSDPVLEYRQQEELAALPELLQTAAFVRAEMNVLTDGVPHRARILLADAGLLDMVPLEVRAGSPDLFRSGPGILVTESAARKFFPGQDPLDKMLEMRSVSGRDERGAETVLSSIVGVIEDPSFTILDDFDFLVSFQAPIPAVRAYRDSDMRHTGAGMMVHLLARTTPGVDIPEVSAKYVQLCGWSLNKDEKEGPMLTPYEDLFFASGMRSMGIRHGNRLYLVVLVILGLLLLAFAVLNYINLSLAACGGRAREMATRRLVGESRGGVIRRCLRESVLFVLVCFVLAALLAWAVAPVLNSIRPVGLTVPLRAHFDGFFLLLGIVSVLGIGGLVGLLPAFSLASWLPLDVVSGRIRRRRKMGFNQVSIVIQSALALLLVVLSITMEVQFRHLRTLDTGISPVQDLYYFHPDFYQSLTGLADRLAASPQVEETCFADGFPTHIRMTMVIDRTYSARDIDCDSVAFRLLGFREALRFEQPHSGTVWPVRSAFLALDISSDQPDPSRLGYLGENQSIGGMLEDFRLAPVNEELRDNILGAVRVTVPERASSGLLVRTRGNHRAFDRFFKETATEYCRSELGMDLAFEGKYNECGYLEDLIARDYDDLHRFTRLVEVFSLIIILLSMLGLLAMSTWYADTHTKGIAIRKVFGGTMNSETRRAVLSYMSWVAVALVLAVPAGVMLVRRFLEYYPERISGWWWIIVVAVLLILAVSFVSVLWQTLRAARTNPAVELKKE